MTELDKGPRNSQLRDIFSKPIEYAAKQLAKIPWLTANMITYFGSGMVAAGSILEVAKEKFLWNNAIALAIFGLLGFGSLGDTLDGPFSRIRKTSTADGEKKDVISDRLQELAMGLARIAGASLRKDRPGVIAATIAVASGPWPSFFRAKTEALGAKVPESGGNPLAILGTRVSRSIFAIGATAFPEIPVGHEPLQHVLDGAVFLGNLSATIERFSLMRKAQKNQLPKENDPQMQENGKKRADLLLKFGLFNTVTALAAGTIAMINAVSP